MSNTHPPYQFEYGGLQSSTWANVLFEIKSLLGRTLAPKRRTPANGLIHLGCGPTVLKGFENLDFFYLQFWRQRHIGHDLRYPLPYADKIFDGAFSEHTLEHLNSDHAIALLREVHRVLKPGAVFRVITPDLQKYVDFYTGGYPSPEFNNFQSGCEAIWSLTQNWGHRSCWDAPMLIRQLKAAGFQSAEQASYREGADARLLNDLADRKWESVYVDAIA